MSILNSIFFFIVAIGVLVTFHEFGHYWVARKAGVKVLRFSIGFGRPLYTWRRKLDGDEIEYVIAAIPLGGYVKMLDEREGKVDTKDLNRAFNKQPVIKRALIVFAGPAFNFILAVFLYWVTFMMGTTVDRPFVGELQPDTIAAQAGFHVKDEILAVEGDKVDSWNEFRLAVLDHGLNGGDLSIDVKTADGQEKTRVLPLGKTHLLEGEGDIFDHIGLQQWWPHIKPQIGGVMEAGAAANAGLEKGDVVLSVDGKQITEWLDLVHMIRNKPNQPMNFVIERNDEQLDKVVIPQSREVDGEIQGYIGAYQHIPDEVRNELIKHIEYSPVDAFGKAVVKTNDMSVLTLRVLWKMVSGEASLSNISGPITIATYAGVTASIGIVSFFSFLAVISVSLGVLNLLPIPMLDGGHLFYYLIEVVKGSPVSETFELRGQQVGIAILAMLMSVAIFNDISRLLQ
jgi:regulator of sigma E protease